MLDVTAAVLQKEGTILICQRPSDKRFGSLWEFPGGKAEPRESLEDCLQREMQEELDVSLKTMQFLKTIDQPETGVRVHFFLCTLLEGTIPHRLEHSDMKWIRPEETSLYSFCPADRLLIDSTAPEILFAF